MTQVCSMKNVDIELQSLFIFFFRLTIDRLENEKKEIQHELHIYKQQSSGTQVNIGGDYGCDIRLKIILVLKQCISIERQPI